MNCNGNYNIKNREKVFQLPSGKEERERWMIIIPRDNIPDTPDTEIGERHFPIGYPTVQNLDENNPSTHHQYLPVKNPV